MNHFLLSCFNVPSQSLWFVVLQSCMDIDVKRSKLDESTINLISYSSKSNDYCFYEIDSSNLFFF